MNSSIQSSANSITIMWLHTAQWSINGNKSIECDLDVTKKMSGIAWERSCNLAREHNVIYVCLFFSKSRIPKKQLCCHQNQAKPMYPMLCTLFQMNLLSALCTHKWILIVKMNERKSVYKTSYISFSSFAITISRFLSFSLSISI